MNTRIASLFLCVAALGPLAACGRAQRPASDKVLFPIPKTGFAFMRPKSWKARVTKRESDLDLPLARAGGVATLRCFAIDYHYTIEQWQKEQQTIAGQLKRTVVRQWQEEILGVPLLLTKTTYFSPAGVSEVGLTGLLYAASPYKLLFRLDVPADGFDEADALWRDAFQSLTTTDRERPTADNPDHSLTKAELAPKPIAPPPVTDLGPKRKVKLVLGSVKTPGKAGGKNYVVRMPAGWRAAVQPDGSWLLSGPSGVPRLKMSLASTLDSDPPDQVLSKQTAATLADFATVEDRTETDGRANLAGASVSRVWREGASSSGPASALDAAVVEGDAYAMLHLVTGALKPAEQAAIDALLDGMSIEPAQ